MALGTKKLSTVLQLNRSNSNSTASTSTPTPASVKPEPKHPPRETENSKPKPRGKDKEKIKQNRLSTAVAHTFKSPLSLSRSSSTSASKAALDASLAEALKECGVLKTECGTLRKDNEGLKIQVSRLRNELMELEASNASLVAENEKATEEINSVGARLGSVGALLDEARSGVRDAEERVGRERVEREKVEEGKRVLERVFEERMNAEVERGREEVEGVRKEAERVVEGLKSDLAESRKETEEERERRGRREEELIDAKERVSEREAVISRLQDEIRVLQESKEDYEKKYEEALQMLGEIEQQLQDEKSEKEKALTEKLLVEELSQKLAEDVRLAREESESRRVSIEEADHALSEIRQSLLEAESLAESTLKAKEEAERAHVELQKRSEDERALVAQQERSRVERLVQAKEEAEKMVRESREAMMEARKQADEYRRANDKVEAEKKGAVTLAQKLEAQGQADRKAVETANLAKEETEAKAKKVLEDLREAEAKLRRKASPQPQPSGSRPVPMVVPSERQYQLARAARQYKEGTFHVAVAGSAGTGKSSLVNAFRGVLNGSPEAALTSIQSDSTRSIGRYPDTRRNYPHIWYDIPGAGAVSVPSWDYFNEQGLFVFDCVVLAWDTRMTDVDVAVLNNCARLNIPCFLVRSKSDVHVADVEDIMREMVDNDGSIGIKEKKSRIQMIPFSARAQYITESRQSVEKFLQSVGLPPQKVYLVSQKAITKIVQGDKNMKGVRVIDEFDLLNDIWSLRRRGQVRSPPVRSNTVPSM